MMWVGAWRGRGVAQSGLIKALTMKSMKNMKISKLEDQERQVPVSCTHDRRPVVSPGIRPR